MCLHIYIDGCSQGNPGPAGCGIVVFKDKQVIYERGLYIGKATNNQAEYHALLKALQIASQLLSGSSVFIHSDSELLVKQMQGKYKVRNPELKGLFEMASHLIERLPEVRFCFIPRIKNYRADRLANRAVRLKKDLGAS